MSEKTGDKKLGRNPFDHKKPSRARRHEPGEAPAASALPAEPAREDPSGHPQLPSGNPGGNLLPANPAWFFVDLWAGAFTEPYFFWAKSMEIMKETIESARH